MFDAPVNWQAFALALLPALLVAWLAARVVRRLARRTMHAIVGDTIAHASPLVRGPVRLVFVGGGPLEAQLRRAGLEVRDVA